MQKTFLGYITALALQIHPQSTIVQWLYSTQFGVLTPPLSLRSVPKGLASIICTVSTFRRSDSRTRVEILIVSATSPLTPGRTKPSFLKPCGYRYPRDEARKSRRDGDNRSDGQLLIQWISPRTLLVERKIKRPTVDRGKSADEEIMCEQEGEARQAGAREPQNVHPHD